MKKRLLALLCALALTLALVLPAVGAPATVYLLAANDKICDLPGGYLPEAKNGVIYVPYTVFDKDATGVDLGVYYGITPERGTILSLYSITGSLVFTVKMGLCEDGRGNAMDFQAVTRNGIPYVPAAAVCEFFGLTYSFLPTTDRGTLIRITSSAPHLSDSLFLSSATTAMTTRYNNIIHSQDPQPSAQPTPAAATATPTPAVTATPKPSESKEHVRVYLAVDASGAESDLSVLFPEEVRALFLFTPDSLPARASQVRKAVAAGHSVGLVVTGTLEEAQAQLERGNELLSHIARVRTRIVSAPEELTQELSDRGWSCWRANVTGTNATSILSTLDLRQTVGYVTLPGGASTISRVLSRVQADGYDLRQPLETNL